MAEATERHESVSLMRNSQFSFAFSISVAFHSISFSFFLSICVGPSVHNANMRNPDNYVPCSSGRTYRVDVERTENQHAQGARTFCPATHLWSPAICWKKMIALCSSLPLLHLGDKSSSPSVGKRESPLWKMSHCLGPTIPLASNRKILSTCTRTTNDEQRKRRETERLESHLYLKVENTLEKSEKKSEKHFG